MVILSACFLIFAQKDILAKYYLIKTAYQPQPITSAASVPVKYANGSDYRLHLNPEGPIATVKGAKPVGSAITLPPAVTAKSENENDACTGDAGSLDFSKTTWIDEVEYCVKETITLADGSKSIISRDKEHGSQVEINGFPVTVEEYQKALDGETVVLVKKNGDSTELKIPQVNNLKFKSQNK
ncbi:uncharacterized protein LOC111713011 isoform X2 [Eurytemora carolleeae]|uniref:uncharacterized protein LOC111713011 isoform X2 n=1 Tax=Eurytemora carolleeae TaxID=1294199 RepID=UPI000C775008|nr:uncharacterized protein LOC111713011 isoform X2 [Eurytemora carolleeae]|eukprot:XP_023343561.1 uncharacterized protein LOC111713011 isoform X2 [Eurytemora affinis]